MLRSTAGSEHCYPLRVPKCCCIDVPMGCPAPSLLCSPTSSFCDSQQENGALGKGCESQQATIGNIPLPGAQPGRGDKSELKRFRGNEQAPQVSRINTSGERNKLCFLYTFISHRVCEVSFILHLTAGLLSPQGMIKP